MSIAIEPLSAENLRVSGDVTTDLAIPFDPADDRFHLGFSDGTLIAGEYDPEGDAFLYVVETEGAGLVRKAGNRLILDWNVEWVTIGRYEPQARTRSEPEPMPLFDVHVPALLDGASVALRAWDDAEERRSEAAVRH